MRPLRLLIAAAVVALGGAVSAQEPSLPDNPYHRSPDDVAHTNAAAPGSATLLAAAPDLTRRRYAGVSEDDIVRALRAQPVLAMREVGNTSINLRCDLEGDIDGAYKPSETRHLEHFRGEIGAFRVAQLLGVERVPPAVLRRFRREELPNGAALSRVRFRDGVSWGAMIYWVPVLRSAQIYSGPTLDRWTRLLTQGEAIPEGERNRAEDVSTVIAFDFLIGNWDRWHGTNTLQDRDGRLVFRDNNGAFYEPMPRGRYEIILAWFQRVQRFSRSFVTHARALTLEALRASIAEDALGDDALLNDAQLRGVLRRRDTLVQYVDALVSIHGEAEVYAFP
jgi:hypothetical protein